MQDRLSLLDLLLDFLHYLLDLSVFVLNLSLLVQDDDLDFQAGLFLGLEDGHKLQQLLRLLLDLGLHLLDLHLQLLQDLRDLMHLQYAPIQNILLLLGLLQQFPVVVDEPVDDFEVVEGVVLEVVLLVVLVLPHKRYQVVVDLQEEVGQAFLVCLLVQVLL